MEVTEPQDAMEKTLGFILRGGLVLMKWTTMFVIKSLNIVLLRSWNVVGLKFYLLYLVVCFL